MVLLVLLRLCNLRGVSARATCLAIWAATLALSTTSHANLAATVPLDATALTVCAPPVALVSATQCSVPRQAASIAFRSATVAIYSITDAC